MTNTRFSKVTTILFDAGNTLTYVDLARVAEIFAESGVTETPEALARAEAAGREVMYRTSEQNPGMKDTDRWETYVGAIFDAIGLKDQPAAATIHDRLFEVHSHENLWRHVPADVPPALDRLLAAGYRLGVISNADGRVPDLLAAVGLASRFETIVDSHLVGVEKPDPRIFEIALARMGERADTSVYVGDFHHVDVVGAERAGLIPVLLDPLGVYKKPECTVIRKLGELETLLSEA